jgi:hypothetical protein
MREAYFASIPGFVQGDAQLGFIICLIVSCNGLGHEGI